eukprot:scaffold9957_cov107-Isochrysis_galbana.AAC.6
MRYSPEVQLPHGHGARGASSEGGTCGAHKKKGGPPCALYIRKIKSIGKSFRAKIQREHHQDEHKHGAPRFSQTQAHEANSDTEGRIQHRLALTRGGTVLQSGPGVGGGREAKLKGHTRRRDA